MAGSIPRNLLSSFSRSFSSVSTKARPGLPKSIAQEIEAIRMKAPFPYLGFHGVSRRSLRNEKIFHMGDYASACDSARLASRQDGGDPLVLFVGSFSIPKKHFMGYTFFPHGSKVEILKQYQISRMKFPDSEF